jgi:hypothetical protein
MTHYAISQDPATPTRSDRAIRNAASRRGYQLHFDRLTGRWSLIDLRLRRPIAGLEGTTLPRITAAVYAVPLPAKRKRAKGRARKPALTTPIASIDQEAGRHG